MSMIPISSSRLGAEPACKFCDAGSTLSFNWEHAKKDKRADSRRDLTVFVEPQPLRYGTLYRCKVCRQPWYMHGTPACMYFVPKDRLALIEEWNKQSIVINADQQSELQKIGRTPPDIYGNGSQFHETPCAVVTTSGQEIEFAVVSLQRHAPFEEWRDYRLASEIAQIRPSRYALPLAVRIASSQADELRMGFAPTTIKLPNGELYLLNWTQHFFAKEGCSTSEIVVAKEPFDWNKMPPVSDQPDCVVYFVADAKDLPASPALPNDAAASSQTGIFSRLLSAIGFPPRPPGHRRS